MLSKWHSSNLHEWKPFWIDILCVMCNNRFLQVTWQIFFIYVLYLVGERCINLYTVNHLRLESWIHYLHQWNLFYWFWFCELISWIIEFKSLQNDPPFNLQFPANCMHSECNWFSNHTWVGLAKEEGCSFTTLVEIVFDLVMDDS